MKTFTFVAACLMWWGIGQSANPAAAQAPLPLPSDSTTADTPDDFAHETPAAPAAPDPNVVIGQAVDRIVLGAQGAPDRIVLRWAVLSPRAWDAGNQNGYVLERATLAPGADPSTATFTPIAELRPWSADRLTGATDYAAAALYLATTPGADAAENLNRHSMALLAAELDSTAAEALALRFVDADVQEDARYAYRLSLGGSAVPVEPGLVDVTASLDDDLAAPEGLVVTPGDHVIRFAWPQSDESTFIGYWLERSDDGGRTYRRLTDRPIVFIEHPDIEQNGPVYADTTVANYTPYHYRLYGITSFATTSRPAEVVAIARDVTPPVPPQILGHEVLEGGRVRLEWQMEGAPSSDLAGYRIGVVDHPDSLTRAVVGQLLPAGTRESIDDRATSSRYFAVAAVDTSGNTAFSRPVYVQIVDTIPPAPPVDIAARIDTMGTVTLEWAPGTEADLFGYRIFQADAADQDFFLLTGLPVESNVYVDSLEIRRSLRREIYYKVAALDNSYNQSEASLVRVPLPDLVPPAAPVLLSAIPTDTTVTITWLPSSSGDVVRHTLQRRPDGGSEWSNVAVAAAPFDTLMTYVDAEVEAKLLYEYQLEAEDSTGFRTPAALNITARPYDAGLRRGVTDVQVDTTDSGVRLTWSYPQPHDGEYWFVVLRSVSADAGLEPHGSGTEPAYVDRDTGGYETIRYAVQVQYSDGAASDVSPPVEVSLR